MLKTIFVFAIAALSILLSIPFGCLAFFMNLLGLKKPAAAFAYRVAWVWAHLLIPLVGCDVTVEGLKNIPRRGGLCLVSNHGSIFDILLALAYVGRPFGFIAKRELIWLPVLNVWISILGGLFIDRKRPRSALRTINLGVRRLQAGGAMLIFPEGHRSRGQGLLPFHPGSFKLATQARVPIVPVSISGSYDVFEKSGRVTAGPVRLVFAPPVDTASIPPEDLRQKLADQVRGMIERNLASVP